MVLGAISEISSFYMQGNVGGVAFQQINGVINHQRTSHHDSLTAIVIYCQCCE